MTRACRFVRLVAGLAVTLAFPAAARAETLTSSTIDSRFYAFIQAPEAAVQRRLPPGWEINPYVQGPYQGTNLILLFIEQPYAADAAGKALPVVPARKLVLVVPVKNPKSPKQTLMVVGGWVADPAEVPGAYRNFTLASEFRHERSAKGSGTQFGAAEEAWLVAAGEAGSVELRARYAASAAARIPAAEQHIYSSAEPSFYRIYRVDSGVELVRSVPGGVDRAQEVRLVVKGPALADLFDGSEKLVAIANVPWYVRQIFLP